MTPSRVLVTGGSGRLGRFVVAEMLQHAEVTVLDIVPPADGAAHVPADIRDFDALCDAARGHDAVIHLAGLDSGVPASEHDYFHVNVQGTWNILAAAEAAGIGRVAVCSSIAAYGLEDLPWERQPDRLPFDESHPLRPCVAYELSKQVVEDVASSFARRARMTVPCLRPAWIIFPDRVADFDRRAREADGALPRPADHLPPPPHRAYVRPDDTARAFWLALTADLEPCEAFNIGASDTMSPAPSLEVMARVYGREIPVADESAFAANRRAAVFGNLRARTRLGWQPTGDWQGFAADPPHAA
ncbi:MAG: NAD(P)-dependent oxidoreductase [Paracoccaceae bacterium]|nr:NAD(P)-dependent oxidoreductase [Paracoccaceae bacterium]